MASFQTHNQDLETLKQELHTRIESADYWDSTELFAALAACVQQDVPGLTRAIHVKLDDYAYIRMTLNAYPEPRMVEYALEHCRYVGAFLEAAADSQRSVAYRLDEIASRLYSSAAVHLSRAMTKVDQSNDSKELEILRADIERWLEEAVETNENILQFYTQAQEGLIGVIRLLSENAQLVDRKTQSLTQELYGVLSGSSNPEIKRALGISEGLAGLAAQVSNFSASLTAALSSHPN